MTRSFLIVLAILSSPRGEEERFNPPLEGAYLGIEVEAAGAGYRVTAVNENTAAARAGLRSGDLLLGLGDQRNLGELDVRQLTTLVRDLAPGKPVMLEVLRQGQPLRLEILPDPVLVRDALHLAAKLKESRFLKSRSELSRAVGEICTELPSAVRRSRRTQEAYEALNRVLGKLGLSHAAVIPPWSCRRMLGAGHKAEDTYHLGFFLKGLRTEAGAFVYHVQSVMPGSPAAREGLKVGDEAVAVNGVEVVRSPRRALAGFEAHREMYVLHVDRDETVELMFRREKGGAVETVELRADTPLSSLRAMQASVRLLETPYGPLGYLHFWDLLPGKLPRVLRETLTGKLRSSRGLVLDLRGRGGQIPVLQAVAKMVEKDGRPVALLIDSETRSAKEVLALLLKGKEGCTLIGEKTAGAVRPGVYVKLPGGGRAMLPASPKPVLKITGGVDLEGAGVVPDIEVDFSLPYAAGRDPILGRAVDHLTDKLAPKRRRLRV